jgi:hypothetical protein
MGHIRANCLKLKSGLRMATTRQDKQTDPAMDPAKNPDLLIEGEGEPQNEEVITNAWEL